MKVQCSCKCKYHLKGFLQGSKMGWRCVMRSIVERACDFAACNMKSPIAFGKQGGLRASRLKPVGLGSMVTHHLDLYVGTKSFFGQLAEQCFSKCQYLLHGFLQKAGSNMG